MVQLSALGGLPAGYIACTSILAYFFIRSIREQGPLIWLPTQEGTPSHLPSAWPRYLTVSLTVPFCLMIGAIMSLTGSSSSALACGSQVVMTKISYAVFCLKKKKT